MSTMPANLKTVDHICHFWPY